MASFTRPISTAATQAIVGLVLVYLATLGRFLGGQCRFHPTCSEYMIQSVRKYGPMAGAWSGLKRIARCHPWGGGGYDPP